MSAKDRKRLLENKKALQDAIKRAMTAKDEEEINRLTKHLNWLENYLKKENRNETNTNSDVPAGD